MTPFDLRTNAVARLQDAEVLFANGRHDGAAYICGYAVELLLKARICDTLNWKAHPPTPGDFKNLTSFKSHELNTLLLLSGREAAIKQSCFAEWSIVKDWKPEMRYKPIGHTSPVDANAFLQATRTLLQQL